MTPIEDILRDWRVRSNQFSPKAWAGHYYLTDEGYKIRGELSLPKCEAENVFWGLTPFAMSDEVDAAAVVLDFDYELWVVRMSVHPGRISPSTKTTYWIVQPDREQWAFVAQRKPWVLGPIPDRLAVLAQWKLEPHSRYTYEQAVLAVSNEYHS